MRIAFLCGALEPGVDGVGDYTRKLALELIKQGHQTVAISLNDSHLNVAREESQESDGLNLLVYRIPKNYAYKVSFALAAKWLDHFVPDLISLQYVPYSFHTKGLPFQLAWRLRTLSNGKMWHIMFHELWIGFTIVSPLKHKVYGLFQKKIAETIVEILSPQLVTTTNRLYQILLQSSKINSRLLPLFSNISIALPDPLFTEKVLELLAISIGGMHEWRLVGIFGNLYPEAELEDALREQLRLSNALNKKVAFIGVGRMNALGIAEFQRLKKLFSASIKFAHLGEQSSENVSRLLQMLHVGISCTPAQHIAKSGVFAAMKLHGLEVILPNEEIIPEYDHEIKQYREALMKRPASLWAVSHIARQFYNMINQ